MHGALAAMATLGLGMPACAALARGGPLRCALAVALAVGVLLLCPRWMAPELATPRLLAALGAQPILLRTLDLARGAPRWSFGRALVHMVSVADSRDCVRAPARWDRAHALAALAYGVLAALGVAAVVSLGPAHDPARHVLRVAGVVAAIYGGVGATYALADVAYRTFGWEPPPMHRAPVSSRTLGEFWSERWNLPVHGTLRRHFFFPVARRAGVRAGLVAAFVASALLHAYPIGVALGPAPAAWMGAFFVAQAVLVLVERALGVARWSPSAGRAWTLGALAVTLPLFVEPALALVG